MKMAYALNPVSDLVAINRGIRGNTFILTRSV